MASYQLQSVSKTFTTKAGKTEALKDISISFSDHGFISILGPSGCGKTTLLNLLGLLEKPTSGTISFHGKDLSKLSEKEADAFRCSHIAFVFQDYNLNVDDTVLENIAIAAELAGKSRRESLEESHRILAQLSLSDYASKKVRYLSGGEQQRIAIARALSKGALVLLCDEATGNLDSVSSEKVLALLKEVSKEKLVVFVTHNEEVAEKYSDQILRMKDGQIKNSKATVPQERKTEPNPYSDQAKSGKLSLVSQLKLIGKTFLKSKTVSLIFLFVMIASFALFSTFSSLSQYDKSEIYADTIFSSPNRVVGITKYVDRKQKIPDPTSPSGYSYRGPFLVQNGLTEEELPLARDFVSERGDVYPSYFYNVSFQDFTASPLTKLKRTDSHFYADSFRQFVKVDDFSRFPGKLTQGRMPERSDEVLLTDYALFSLSHNHVYDGSMLGEPLTNRARGYSFIPVGIVETDYEKYRTLLHNESYNVSQYGYSALDEKLSIYGFSAMLERIQQAKPSTLTCEMVQAIRQNADVNPVSLSPMLHLVQDDLSDDDSLLAKKEGLENDSFGYILNRETALKIAGIKDWETFLNSSFGTEEKGAQAFFEAFKIDCSYWNYDKSIAPAYYASSPITDIIAISNTAFPITLANENFILFPEGSFRGLLLSLNQSEKISRSLVKDLMLPKEKTEKEYEALAENYEKVGYVLCFSLNLVADQADIYLPQVKKMAKDLSWVMLALSLLSSFIFAFISIRNSFGRISVLRSLGMSKRSLALLFSVQTLTVTLISFFLSWPFAVLILGRINRDFTALYGVAGLVFFSLKGKALLLSLLFGFLSSVLGLLIPLILLLSLSPAQMARKTK